MRNRYIIELTSDVKTPKPDRRSGDWYKQPVIEKGTRLAVSERKEERDFSGVVISSITYMVSKITPHGSGGFITGVRSVSPEFKEMRDDLLPILLEKGVRVEPKTAAEMLHVTDADGVTGGASGALNDFVQLGILKLADFEKLVAAPRDDDGNLIL